MYGTFVFLKYILTRKIIHFMIEWSFLTLVDGCNDRLDINELIGFKFVKRLADLMNYYWFLKLMIG